MMRLGVRQRCFFLVLLVFSCTPLTCNASIFLEIFYQSDLDALQAVWGAWNTSTPEPESNLAGWNSSQEYPCIQDITLSAAPNWRGVQCLMGVDCFKTDTTGDGRCTALIVGLSLEKASIVGTLPPEIGNIYTLTTLELTGNPNLTGTLPATLTNTNLYTLDLHDNGFYGEIPDFGNFKWPLILDLSGNAFTGSFPLPQIRSMVLLQKLSLGRNDFYGEIPALALQNMTQLAELDLSNNNFNGSPPTLSMIRNLQTLDLSNNNFSGSPPTLSMMSNLQTLDLSSNNFNGPLPTLTMLKNLQTLNLSRNAFTGSIFSSSFDSLTESKPSVMDLSHNQLTSSLDSWNTSELGSLQELYLDNNFINGTLNITQLLVLGLLSTKSTDKTPSLGPPSGLLTVLSLRNNSISNVVCDDHTIDNIATIFRLEGNPYCAFNDGSIFYHQACNPVPMNNDKRKVVIIATVTSAISVLLMITLAATLYRHYKYKEYSQLQMQKKFEEFEVKPTIFPYNQLRTATRDFHVDMKLGQGAFGAVYKGIFPNGNVMAVKQLFAKTTQGIDEFLNEVVLLTGMKHRNLVNLKGCCIREQQRLLVYEYVDNYDVEKVLLAGPNKTVLSWPVRLKICLGVARGLHYLHALAHPRIIHRDIKASNVLLAKNYDTKIADFGLASLFPDEESYIMTKHVAGTKGYLAPEYASFGQLSDKVDVFSFGVLCLEVASGRRNIDETLPPGEMYLSKWAWELLQRDSLVELVDRTMSLPDEEKLEVHRLINIALLCIQTEAEQRPSMERVVAMLQGDSQSEAVVPKPGNEEQYLESIRLFDVGKSSLTTVKEESESSLMNSSRRGGGYFEENVSTDATYELREIRVR